MPNTIFHLPKQTTGEAFAYLADLANKSDAKIILVHTFLNGAVSDEWVPAKITELIKNGKAVFLVPEGPGHITNDGRRLGVMDFDYKSNIEAYRAGGVPLENVRTSDFNFTPNPLHKIIDLKLESDSPFEIAKQVQKEFFLKEEDINNAELWKTILKRREQIAEFQKELENNIQSERSREISKK